jgi:predicted nucleotidyltransferase
VIDPATIQRAVELIAAAAPGSTVILFGSYARGDALDSSDLDLLVLEPELQSRRDEMVRLRDALRPLRIPVDVVVASRGAYLKWADTPGTLYYHAAQEGRVVSGGS